jgi:hypothetical protein
MAPEGAPRSFIPPASVKQSGYSADACPAEVVLRDLHVKNGRLVLPHGMSYRVLVLPAVERMTPRLLRRIKQLVDAGAVVIGEAMPGKSPSLSGYPRCDEEVRTLAAELWGKGKVVRGKSVQQVLASLGVPPDLDSRAFGQEVSVATTAATDGPLTLPARVIDRTGSGHSRRKVS